MFKPKIVFITILLMGILFAGSQASAQNSKKLLKNANSFFDKGLYKEAIAAFNEVLKLEPDNAEANYKMGYSYLKTINRTKSLPYLIKANKSNPQIAEDIKYLLATSYHLNHKFEEAFKLYTEFKKTLDVKKKADLIAVIDRNIYECENGMEYIKNPVKAKIENLGAVINTQYSDFAPVITADESILVFTSRRPGSTGGQLDQRNVPYEDVYVSYNKNGKWTEPQNIGKPINTSYHDASIAISPDGSHIFIYKDDNAGDIFMSTFEGESWGKPQDMGKNVNTKSSETSISMTADGNTIYFTSNRDVKENKNTEGSKGGFDIYMSKKDKKGKWGEAVNLGPVINTPYDEEAPFIHPDGRTLYFSSKGHAGMGGFDIFKSTLQKDGTWSEPENLGYPINTAEDDIYFVLSADNKHGYYSSEKEDGFGEQDIYIISMPEPEELAAIESKDVAMENKGTGMKKMKPIAKVQSFNPITILKGTITDELTKEPIECKLVITDNDKNEVITELKSNAATGGYLVVLPSGKNYGIAVEKKEYLFHSENFDIPESNNYQEIVKDIELKKVILGSKIVLRNIFFDFDKATLRSESTAELERLYLLMVENKGLKIEISGHTDNKGSADYNKKLSQERAKAVVDYLIKKGITSDRLKFAGYGFDRPLASNDTEEGRQLNRRTEFEIIGN
ncbi:MAG: OmpA family protein [Cytophagaceae bacterium]